jgi:hypothetical protein
MTEQVSFVPGHRTTISLPADPISSHPIGWNNSRLTHLTASHPGVTSNVVQEGSSARILVKSSCERLLEKLARDASETSPMNLTPDLPWEIRVHWCFRIWRWMRKRQVEDMKFQDRALNSGPRSNFRTAL